MCDTEHTILVLFFGELQTIKRLEVGLYFEMMHVPDLIFKFHSLYHSPETELIYSGQADSA